MTTARALALLVPVAFFAAGCNRTPPHSEDLIAQSWRADLYYEPEGQSLIRDGDDPNLLEGWASEEIGADGRLTIWSLHDRSILLFHLNRAHPLQLRFTAIAYDYPGRPAALMPVKVNGVELGQAALDDNDYLVFNYSLPESVLRAGENRLEFVHPWPRSPKSLSLSEDYRPLAVNFKELWLVDAGSNTGASASNTVDEDSPVMTYDDGWWDEESHPEGGVKAFRWMSGVKASLKFSLKHPDGDLAMKYMGTVFRPPGRPVQFITWSLNGIAIGEQAISEGWNKYEVNLPRAYLRKGQNILIGTTSYALRPSDEIKSDDSRTLSVAVGDPLLHPGAPAFPTAWMLTGGGDHLSLPANAQLAFTFRLPVDPRLEYRIDEGSASFTVVQEGADGVTETLIEKSIHGGASGTLKLPGRPGDLVRLRLSANSPRGTADENARLRFSRLTLGSRSDQALWPDWVTSTPAPAANVNKPRTILIYLVDTLRADHLGPYDYARPTTPNLSEFTRTAETYDQAWAVTSWTKAATASLLTGLPPDAHGAGLQLSFLRPEVQYLPALLRQAGYRTEGIVTNPYVSASFGFQRGYDNYQFVNKNSADFISSVIANQKLENVLAQTPDTQPLFVYMHTIDPHTPYAPLPGFNRFTPPESRQSRYSSEQIESLNYALAYDPVESAVPKHLENLYDGEILQMDASFGETLNLLRRHGREKDALIVFVSDHGEEFGDHHGLEHGKTLFHEVTHIPLIIRWPDGRHAGARRVERVSQLDLLPTILAETGTPCPAGYGTALQHPVPEHRLLKGMLRLDGREETAVLTGPWNYHRADNRLSPQYFGRALESLYDHDADPDERHNLVGAQPLLTAFLRAISRSQPGQTQGPASKTHDLTDEATIRQLKSLGYLH